MEPQGYVKKTWDTEYITKALEMSDKALHAHGMGSSMAMYSDFLSQRRNFFLIGNGFNRATVLVESRDVGDKWGADDFMVSVAKNARDMAGAAAEEKMEWLKCAASFDGTVYLVDVKLNQQEQQIWWRALARAHTSSPISLFILYDFGTSSTNDLMVALSHNPRIRNLALFDSNLYFNHNSEISEAIPLNTLHLEKFHGSSRFLSALSKREVFDVSHTLSLIDMLPVYYPVSDSFEVDDAKERIATCLQPHTFLEWQLTHLNLIGFYSRIELIPFMQSLEQCSNVSLCSVSLDGTVRIPNQTDSILVGAVVDALHNSGLQFLNLGGLEREPTIQAQLLRNRRSHALRHPQTSKVPARAMRLFICGDAYAGKTTLLSTLSTVGSGSVLDKLKAVLRCQRFRPHTLERTRGIEIRSLSRDDIHLSIWDMAGQTEFHAFHDHMLPDPSASHGSPTMFMFVWSPMDSNNERRGKFKTQEEFESSFRYWLKFITSKTRQSNILRKLIVVLTRKDQTQLVRDALEASIHVLSTTFSNIIQVVEVLEVDARSEASVKPLLSCIFKTACDVLKGVEVYNICSQVSEYLHNQKSPVGKQPIISWRDFSALCSKQFNVTEPEVQKAIAYSLNESGDVIHLSNLPFLVLDPNWFCNEVMGTLIHFPQPGNSRVMIPINGFAKQDYLEKLLKESSRSTVEGSVLLALMEAMHLCCKVPGDAHGMIFIPATLFDSNTSHLSRHLQWRGAIGGRSSTQEYAYVGRRLECDKKDLTFLTPGFFPTMQVAFNKAFCESKDDVQLGKADVQMGKFFMSVCVQDSEIIVELGLAKGEHVIDVMVRAPNDEDVGHTLVYVEDKIIRTVIGVCAQPVGNQGVRLVEGVIRPDCLHTPSPPHVRADQCALIRDLKQELKEQLERGRRHEKLLHFWEGNNHLQPVTSHFIDLLGPKEFMKVLMSYKASLEEVSLMSVTSTAAIMEVNQTAPTSGRKALMQEDINAASTSSDIRGDEVVGSSTASQGKILKEDGAESQASHGWITQERAHVNLGENEQESHEWITQESVHVNLGENEQVVDALSKSMVKEIYQKMQSMDGKLEGLKRSVDSMHADIGTMYKTIVDLRSHALPKVQKLVENSLSFAVENEAGKIPRFVFLTTDDTLGFQRRMVTALIKGLKHVRIELFCEHRDGPHRVDGQKGLYVTTMDDEKAIRKALPYVNRFLKVLTLVAKVGAHVFAGAGSTVPDLSQLVALAMDTPGFLDNQGSLSNISTSPDEDLNGWRQWLVSVLEKNGGMTESNISSKFLLRRALYKDTSKVSWLCDMHYKYQCPLPLV